MKEKIDIFVFNKTKICKNARHKIEFNDDNDIYNPFSMKNLALSACIDDAFSCDDFIALSYEFAVKHDYDCASLNLFEKDFIASMKEKIHSFILSNRCSLPMMNLAMNCLCMKLSVDFGLEQRKMNVLFHALMMNMNLLQVMIVDVYMR